MIYFIVHLYRNLCYGGLVHVTVYVCAAILEFAGARDSQCVQVTCPQALLLSVAATVARDMGGSSGAVGTYIIHTFVHTII